MNARQAPRGSGDRGDTTLIAGTAVVASVVLWAWASLSIAGRLSSGEWPDVSLQAAAESLVRVRSHLSNPWAALPVGLRTSTGRPPDAWLVYGASLTVVVLVAAGFAAARKFRGRSPSRGSSARTRGAGWATASDTIGLRISRRKGRNRLVLGRVRDLAPRRPLVATEARHSVLVLGPTQSGKTSGLAIPAILDWDGPVIATSVKDDLARATLPARSARGPVWVFDPTSGSGLGRLARWSPLSVCGDWAASQKMAAWLVEATPARSGLADAAFWYAAASKQLAPLLLAAAGGAFTMADVVRWTNSSDLTEPGAVLHALGEFDAALALSACNNRDERIRSSVSTTLETVLAPFEDPGVASSTSGHDIDLDTVIGTHSTLYLCGPSHEQSRVQGLFAALVSAAIASATSRVAALGRPLDPPLLVVLDEAANIAPVRDLDTIASTSAGLGVQLVTVCQDLSQLSGRYGQDRARTIVNNHRAKLLLSGVSDLSTLDLISGLAGEHAVREHTFTLDQRDGRRTRSSAIAFRRLAPADELRRVPPGEAVLVYGHLPPVRLRLRPWFKDRHLAAVARGGIPAQRGGGLRALLGATRGGSPGILG